MITEKVNARSHHYKERILKEDGLFNKPAEEVDLSQLIKQWKMQFNKKLLRETLNLIHMKETELIKRDLEREIKTIDDSSNALGSSDGFSRIGKKLGLSQSSIFASKSQSNISQLLSKNGNRHIYSYSQLKEQRKQEEGDGIQKVEEAYKRIKKIETKRDENILKMKEKVKVKETKLKKLEELALQKYDDFKEKKEELMKKKKEQVKGRAKERILREKELRAVMKKKPKFEEINDNFNSTLETNTLQKKKQALATLRKFHQPIDFRQVEEEQLKKEMQLRERNDQYRLKLAEKIKKNGEDYDQTKLSTRYYERAIEENQERIEQENKKETYKKTLNSKMKSYSYSIKDKFIPEVSHKKQEELRRRKQSLEISAKEKYKSRVFESDNEKRKKIYTERMRVYKSVPNREKMNQTPTIQKHAKIVDYLREFRESKKSKKSTDKFNTIPKSKKHSLIIF